MLVQKGNVHTVVVYILFYVIQTISSLAIGFLIHTAPLFLRSDTDQKPLAIGKIANTGY